MTSVFALAADWALSWLLHATAASILTLAAARWLVADPKLRDLLWKAALVLPLGTSLPVVTASPIVSGSLDLARLARPHMPPTLRSMQVSAHVASTEGPATIDIRDATAQGLRYAILGVILIPSVVAVSRMTRVRRRFRRTLRTRRVLDAQTLSIDTRELSRAGKAVRISVSPHMVTAAAVARGEICVSAAFATLRPAERRAILAHEIAHLERGDLAWIAFADAVAGVLAAQPLVGMVARRLRQDAEFICDDIAVTRTGDAAAYVRALTVCARAYGTSEELALAYGSSPIVRRAERVLGLHAACRRRRASVATAFVAVMLLGSLLTLPRVRTGDATRTVRAQVSAIAVSGSSAQEGIVVRLDVR